MILCVYYTNMLSRFTRYKTTWSWSNKRKGIRTWLSCYPCSVTKEKNEHKFEYQVVHQPTPHRNQAQSNTSLTEFIPRLHLLRTRIQPTITTLFEQYRTHVQALQDHDQTHLRPRLRHYVFEPPCTSLNRKDERKYLAVTFDFRFYVLCCMTFVLYGFNKTKREGNKLGNHRDMWDWFEDPIK